MKKTINISITLDTDKEKGQVHNAIRKGLYYGLDITHIASPSNILDISFQTMQRESKYKKGFEELMCYFDSISDEEQPKLVKRLENLGLL